MEISNLLQLQQDVAIALAQDDVDSGIQGVLEALCRRLNWQMAAFWTSITSDAQLTCKHVYTSDNSLSVLVDQTLGARWNPHYGLPGEVLEKRKAIWKTNLGQIKGIARADAISELNLSCMIGFPLIYRGKILGVCEIFGRDIVHEDSILLRLLDNIGLQLGQMLYRMGVEEELKRQQREQVVLLESLSENEQRMRQVLSSALDAVVVSNEESIVIGWNDQAEKIFGYSASEAIGRPMCELIIPEPLRAAHMRGMQRFLQTETPTILNSRIEISSLRKNGEVFPVELTVTAQKVKGAYNFTAFIRDISFAKKTENALREGEARLNLAVCFWLHPCGAPHYAEARFISKSGLQGHLAG